MKRNADLAEKDPAIASFIEKEKERLSQGLELIPSENVVSKAVLEALGSVLTNKYSEGYPGKRYYGGNEYIDEIEKLAQDRAKKLFGAEHANVQPYSGSPANLAVFAALAGKGGKLMGMRLDMGGHLTHGHKVSVSGKFFESVQYGVDRKTGLIDYDEVRRMAKQEKPSVLISGASAYPRKIDFKQFHEIAEDAGALSMADISHISGLIIGNQHPSPFPFTDVVTTTTHKTLRGPRGAMILCKDRFAKQVDSAVFPLLQGGPHNNNIAAIAVALKEASTDDFKQYARQIVMNAKQLAGTLMDNGIKLVTDGTDNHLILVDLTGLGISGKEAETALNNAGITVNKNAIPYDPRGPLDPSGIRLGTPAITTRGMKEPEIEIIAYTIAKILKNSKDAALQTRAKLEIKDLCSRFPIT